MIDIVASHLLLINLDYCPKFKSELGLKQIKKKLYIFTFTLIKWIQLIKIKHFESGRAT